LLPFHPYHEVVVNEAHAVPPQAPDIERAVLGAMLFEKEAIDIAAETIGTGTDVFYKPAHGIIFDAIVSLHNETSVVDQLTLTEELRTRGLLEKIGGEGAIASLCGEINPSANTAAHCKILREKAALRKLIAITTSIRGMCCQANADPDELASLMYLQSVAVMDTQDAKPYRTISEVVLDAYDWLAQKANQSGTMGVPTGLKLLDKYTDGWHPGDLIAMAGETGKGKSALAINRFALKAAESGIPTVVFSLEMSDVQIGVRLVSGEARMDLSAVQYNKPTAQQWQTISNACSKLGRLPLYIDETPGINIGQIGAKIRRLQRDKGVKLVIVDYLQLMEGKSDAQNREREVASISRGLKLLAKSLKVPVIALSQLNEAGKLRESRAIEQDTDKIIIITDPTESERSQFGFGENAQFIRGLNIQKNRGGKTGKIFIRWIPEHVTFVDLDY